MSNNIYALKSLVRGVVIGSLLLWLFTFPASPVHALSGSWASGVWTTGNPTTTMDISSYTVESGWPGSGCQVACSPTFSVLSVTASNMFFQISGSPTNNGCLLGGPSVTTAYSTIGGPLTTMCYTINVEDGNYHTFVIVLKSYCCNHGNWMSYAYFNVDGNTIQSNFMCYCHVTGFNNILAPDFVIESYYSQNGNDFANGQTYGYMRFFVSGTLYNEQMYAYNGGWNPPGYNCVVPSQYQTGNFNIGSGLAPPSTTMGVSGHSRGWGNSYQWTLTGLSVTGKILSYNIPQYYCNAAVAAS